MMSEKKKKQTAWPLVEKRQRGRFAYDRPISFVELGQPGRFLHLTPIAGRIINLSNGGMQILSDGRALERETVVRVLVPLHDSPVTVPVLGEVQWGQESTPGKWHVGLRFLLNGA